MACILVDTDGNEVLTQQELQQAMRNPEMVKAISKLICKHTSEWDTWKNISSFENEVMAIYAKGIDKEENGAKKITLEQARDERLALIKQKIEHLCFWDKITEGDITTKEERKKAFEKTNPKPKKVNISILPDAMKPKTEADKKWDKAFEASEKKHITRSFPCSNSSVYHFHPIAFINQLKLMFPQGGNTGECFCNKDFAADDLKAMVKRIRDNTFYDGKAITEFHHEELFYGRGGVPKSDQTFDKFAEVLNASFTKHGITNCIHKIHFLANMYVETMYFTATEEIPDPTKARYNQYKPYVGRGFMHLTWEANYKSYSDVAGNTNIANTTDNVKVASDLNLAADTAGWFWKNNKLNDISNTDSILKTTKKINGGTHGYKDRRIAWIKLKEIFNYPYGCSTDASKHEAPVYGEGVLEEMRKWADQHVQYKQELGSKYRTAVTDEALGRLDCSEFVCRYLHKLGVTDSIKSVGTKFMTTQEKFRTNLGTNNIDHITGSEALDFIPQAGDIFVWRKLSGGHTGIVHSVDGDKITILESIGHNGSSDEDFNNNNGGYEGQNSTRTSVYSRTGGALASHSGWKGYFRPKNYTKQL